MNDEKGHVKIKLTQEYRELFKKAGITMEDLKDKEV